MMDTERLIAQAQDYQTPPCKLRQLAKSGSLKVQLEVYRNPNAPSSLREELKKRLAKILPLEGYKTFQ